MSVHQQGTDGPRFIEGIKQGPHPIISDSLFSLIIFIYVAIVFLYMFYAFCWREPPPPGPDPDAKNIPMITSMLEEMQEEEKATANGNGVKENGNGETLPDDREADDKTTQL